MSHTSSPGPHPAGPGENNSDDEIGPQPPTRGQSNDSDDDDIGPQPPTKQQKNQAHEEDDIGPQPPTKEQQQHADEGDDIGPQPPTKEQQQQANDEDEPKKKRRKVDNEDELLQSLPCAGMYERSYMHRDAVMHTCVASTEFIITASNDGQLKFWKKMPRGIEFVKQYRAHLGEVKSMSISADGQYLATVSNENSAKVFHVTTFDMIRMIKLDFSPNLVAWVYNPKTEKPQLAVTSKEDGRVAVFDVTNAATNLEATNFSIHNAPITAITFNPIHSVVISADQDSIVEYWSTVDPSGRLPEGTVRFELKSETSLFKFLSAKARVHHIAVSPNGNLFATTSSDMIIRVFRFVTGKLIRAYDESITAAHKVQKSTVQPNPYKLDDIDFGRRMAVEKELAKSDACRLSNVLFDESSTFVLYPTYLGIKIVNVVTNKVKALLGKVENTERFLSVSLYQGRPSTNIYNPVTTDMEDDPTVVCAAFKRQRFYLFTRREPDDEGETGATRDTLNEKPTAKDLMSRGSGNHSLGSSAVLHTTLGDITIKLFPNDCPKTVENFSTHAKNGYYNNMIFHRVIKGFMVQTGCPVGDGTGGVSIWGGEFEDEIRRDLRHDRPFTVSMANAGPNTNGSQFFITTQPAQWLDGKHTVFGRVTAGMDVVTKIERLKTDKFDKPHDPPKIMNIDLVE